MTGRPPPSPQAHRRARRRRVAVITVVVFVVVLGAGWAFTGYVAARESPTGSAPPVRHTTTVRRTDLVVHVTAAGTPGWGGTSKVVGRRSGTLTALPAPGTVIHRGEALYSVDAVPVALWYGATPSYRDLSWGVEDGPDIRVLRDNLAGLGHLERDAAASDEFDRELYRAVRRWQRATGREITGEVGLGDVIVLPGEVRVHGTAQLGAAADGEVLTVTGTERMITARLERAQSALAQPGAAVTVELADGRTTPGRITATGGDDEAEKVDVTVRLSDKEIARKLPSRTVLVRFSGERRDDVLAVPVEALLAVRQGGYALEVVRGDGTSLVTVRPGLFADDLVEVQGAGLTDGTTVVTAS